MKARSRAIAFAGSLVHIFWMALQNFPFPGGKPIWNSGSTAQLMA